MAGPTIEYGEPGNVISLRTLAPGETVTAEVDFSPESGALGGDLSFAVAAGEVTSERNGVLCVARLETPPGQPCDVTVEHIVSIGRIAPGDRQRKTLRITPGRYDVIVSNLDTAHPATVSVTSSRLVWTS